MAKPPKQWSEVRYDRDIEIASSVIFLNRTLSVTLYLHMEETNYLEPIWNIWNALSKYDIACELGNTLDFVHNSFREIAR